MKKALLLICILFLVGCTKAEVKMHIGSSSIFSDEERENAIQLVVDGFSFPGADLLEVWYDEQKSLTEISYHEKEIGWETENTIVIFSKFYVSGSNQVLNRFATYDNYMWILKRENTSKSWRIVDSGY